MSDVISSLSDAGLIEAVEINYQHAMIHLGHLVKGTIYHDVGATWFVDEHIGFSSVSTLQLAVDTPERQIDEVLKRIRASSEVPIEWNVGPSMRTAGIENRLLVTGWSKVDTVPALALDLDHLDTQEGKIPAGLTIELIDNDVAFKQYVNIMAAGFEFPEAAVNYIANLHYGHEFLEDKQIRQYLGRVDGEPVAIAVLFLSGGVAGIYNIATIPQMRRRGIGRAMMLAPLYDARKLDYHVAVIEAGSESGLKLYHQLGFQDSFLFDTYRSRKDSDQ